MRKSIATIVMCLSIFFLETLKSFAANLCDRKCLERHMDEVLEAMIEPDPGQLKLSKIDVQQNFNVRLSTAVVVFFHESMNVGGTRNILRVL